jgi:DNA-binding response OmpR family regulator
MKILIAEDDAFFRQLLHRLLASESEIAMVADGAEAWALMQQMEGPLLAILDWVMPGMAGPEICRAARASVRTAGTYLILLTARHSSADILAGLRSGADDYVTKPFKPEELRARVRLGQRIIRLEQTLTAQASAIESARTREIFLQSRLSEIESGRQDALAKAASAGAMYAGSLESLPAKPEFNAASPAAPALPVNKQ